MINIALGFVRIGFCQQKTVIEKELVNYLR